MQCLCLCQLSNSDNPIQTIDKLINKLSPKLRLEARGSSALTKRKFARPLILVNLSLRQLPKTARLLLLTLYGMMHDAAVIKKTCALTRYGLTTNLHHGENEGGSKGSSKAAIPGSTSRRRFRPPLPGPGWWCGATAGKGTSKDREW